MNFEEWYATQDKNVFRSGEEHMRLAYSAGAEQMRERAAELCGGIINDEFSDDHLAKAIRALPIGESSGAPQEKP